MREISNGWRLSYAPDMTSAADTRIPRSAGKVNIQVETLASYRKEISAMPNLIKWVSQARVNSFTVYAGKR